MTKRQATQGKKWCYRCDKEYPSTAEYFYRDSSRWDKLNHECKTCSHARRKKYISSRPDKGKTYSLKYDFGITFDTYQELLLKQDGKCAICKCLPGKRKLAVDHCHESGAVRGLLCHRCNTALGLLKEDLSIMRSLMEYTENICNI